MFVVYTVIAMVHMIYISYDEVILGDAKVQYRALTMFVPL